MYYNMKEDLFTILGVLAVGCFIVYVSLKIMQPPKKKEGLTNSTDTNTNSSSSSSLASGEAGTAASYSAGIKAEVIKLQDELLVSKYRKEYESAIINLDDYVGYLMVKQSLNINTAGTEKSVIDSFNNLNTLKQAKDSLNATMAFLDKQ